MMWILWGCCNWAAYQTFQRTNTCVTKAHESSSSGIVLDWKSSAYMLIVKAIELVGYPEDTL